MKHLAVITTLATVISVVNGCSKAKERTPSKKNENAGQRAENSIERQQPADLSNSAPRSPEQTLRQFLIAMLSGDRESLENAALSHDDLELLISTNQASQSQLDEAKKQFEGISITRLEVGDSFRLPSGDMLDVNEQLVADDRQLLTFPGNPLPFKLKRGDDGQWRVNAETIIATRKAAQKNRGR